MHTNHSESFLKPGQYQCLSLLYELIHIAIKCTLKPVGTFNIGECFNTIDLLSFLGSVFYLSALKKKLNREEEENISNLF